MFADCSLSGSGTVPCRTCHDPEHAFASAIDEPVPVASANLDTSGFRNAPSLMYAARTPTFSFDRDGAPSGGFNRDGRANSPAEQAHRPFLAEHEMANDSVGDVSVKLSRVTYADEFIALFGADIFDQPQLAFERAVAAIARCETEDPDFAPFSSKYDDFLAGHIQLSDAELRGLALFNNPLKGNCAACHPADAVSTARRPCLPTSATTTSASRATRASPAIIDPTYFDLRLCAPFRIDLATARELRGAFKVPTLRNIARTAPYHRKAGGQPALGSDEIADELALQNTERQFSTFKVFHP